MFKVSVRSTAAMRTAVDDQNSNSASQTFRQSWFLFRAVFGRARQIGSSLNGPPGSFHVLNWYKYDSGTSTIQKCASPQLALG